MLEDMNTGMRSVPLGHVRDIPVGAHWSTLVALIIIAQVVAISVLPQTAPGHSPVAYWATAVVAALAFTASLLAHELAHALTAKRLGVGVQRIDLWLLGGVSRLASASPSPRVDFLVAVAGPAASVAVGIAGFSVSVVLSALGAPALVVTPVVWLAVTNGILAVFNLVPAAPLDGGRVLRAAVWWRTGDQERGEKVATVAGRAFGIGLGALGLVQAMTGQVSGLWLVLLGGFLAFTSNAEQSFNRVRHRLDGVLVRDVMTPEPVIAPGWWTAQAFLHAVTADPHQRVFPVVSFDGIALGLVSIADLVRVPDRLNTRVSDACRPLTTVPVARPGEPALDVLSRTALLPGRDVVLVLDDHQAVAGVVGTEDFAWAVELAGAVRLGDREEVAP